MEKIILHNNRERLISRPQKSITKFSIEMIARFLKEERGIYKKLIHLYLEVYYTLCYILTSVRHSLQYNLYIHPVYSHSHL